MDSAFWVVRQALGHLDIHGFVSAATEVASAVEDIVGTGAIPWHFHLGVWLHAFENAISDSDRVLRQFQLTICDPSSVSFLRFVRLAL